jgi:hypothetical protein
MEYPFDIPLGGLKRDFPEQLLETSYSSDLDGVWPINGKLRRMPGKVKLVSNALDSTSVQGMANFSKDDGSNNLIACTQEKIYKHNAGSGTFDSIHSGSDFTGGRANLFDYAPFYDSGSTNEILVITNGVDEIKKWTGSGNIDTLGGSPAKCKYLEVFKDYLFQGYTVESGTDYPRRLRFSGLGNGENWPAANYIDLLKSSDQILRPKILRNNLIVYKENSISLLAYVGGSLLFNLAENYISERGLLSSKAVINWGHGQEVHFFPSSDLEIYKFDGIDLEIISDNISTVLQNMSPTYREYIVGLKSEEYDKLVWAIPGNNQDGNYDLLIFDLKLGSWWIREGETVDICSAFVNEKGSTLTWDTLPYGTWNEFDVGLGWDSLGNNKTTIGIFGGDDGYVRYWLGGVDDDGTAITSHFRYPFNNFNTNDRTLKHLNKVIIETFNEGSGSISLEVYIDQNKQNTVSLDDDNNMSKTISLAAADENMLHEIQEIDVDVIGYNFSLKLSSSGDVWSARVLGVEYEIIGTGIA